MKPKNSSLLGFLPAVFAPFLLFNPEFAVVDVLPDIIAYLLMVCALSKLRDTCTYLTDAYDRFRKMILISGVKLLAVFWIFGLLQLSERATAIMLFSFAFAVVELIWLIPAWKAFFDGMAFLSDTLGGSAPAKHGGRAKRTTMFFIIFKAVMSVLPEASSLFDPLYSGTHIDWANFTGLFRAGGMLLIIIAGIVWIVVMERYLVAVCRDREFFSAAAAKYEHDFGSKPGAQIRRTVRTSLILFTAASLLSADLVVACSFGSLVTVEVPVNIIPDVLCGAFFLIAFVAVRELFPRWYVGAALSGAYALFSGVSWYVSFRFHYEYTDTQIHILPRALDAFLKMFAVNSLNNLLFLAVVLYACVAIAHIIRNHCGYIPDTLPEQYREDKLADIRRGLLRRLNVCAVAAFAVALSSIAYDFVLTLPDFIGSGFWWMIDLTLSAILFVTFITLSGAVTEEADSRYMLD